MPRRSSIERLKKDLKEKVDTFIARGWTIDEIVQCIQEQGGEVSRSAVGRYKKRREEQMAKFQEAQQVAGAWVKQIGENPDSDVGRLIAEMLKVIAFEQLANMSDEESTTTPMDIMLLGKAMQHVEQASRLAGQRVDSARSEALKQATDAVKKEARRQGLSKAAIQKIEDEIGLL